MDAKNFSTRDAARILDATEEQIRTYARLGEVAPHSGPDGRLEFGFQDLLLLRTTKGLLEAGVPPRSLRGIWKSLRGQVMGDLPLTSLSIEAEGGRAVVSDGEARWRPDSGQFLLDFDGGEVDPGPAAPALRPPIAIRSVTRHVAAAAPETSVGVIDTDEESPALTAEQWFQLACELEPKSPHEARHAYQQALEIDPDLADAHLNLGRIEHEAGELGKAEAHYREAVRCAPEDPVGHFNLGVLLEDRGRPDEAVHAYRQVIARDPDDADAHYNLALLLEATRQRSAAMRHLMIARRLYGQPPAG